ncbi:hypothetical protein [Arthrobacter sp. 260]|nr:hypothetical protein [Arthrobacter sp. 260]NOJ61599.1 hypothetical protein [Arthrobacter sp. 260]
MTEAVTMTATTWAIIIGEKNPAWTSGSDKPAGSAAGTEAQCIAKDST